MAELTWETAADWDDSQDEEGVVHENFGDHQDSRIDLGYPSFDRGGSDLEVYIPFDEDSGESTVADVTGNGHDADVNGATLGEPGMLGTTTGTLDGSDDYYRITHDDAFIQDTFTIWMWMYFDPSASGNDDSLCGFADTTRASSANEGWWLSWDDRNDNDRELRFPVYEPSGDEFREPRVEDAITSAGIYSLAGVVDVTDTGQVYLYLDGDEIDKVSISDVGSNSKDLLLGTDKTDEDWFVEGWIDEFRFYTRALSASEIQDLHDVASSGYLTTEAKTA